MEISAISMQIIIIYCWNCYRQTVLDAYGGGGGAWMTAETMWRWLGWDTDYNFLCISGDDFYKLEKKSQMSISPADYQRLHHFDFRWLY